MTRNDGDQFRYNEQDHESDHTSVSANYQDTCKAKCDKAITSEKSKVKHLKGKFANREEAERASKIKMAEIKRQMAKFSITTAYGLPEFNAESPMKLQGFKTENRQAKMDHGKSHSYIYQIKRTRVSVESRIRSKNNLNQIYNFLVKNILPKSLYFNFGITIFIRHKAKQEIENISKTSNDSVSNNKNP